jgi:nucleotide-binding universal stress UspA family protein
MSGLMSILAATDGSEHGLGAVVTGAALAERAGAEFHITTVVEVLLVPPAYIPPGVDAARYEPDFIREAREKATEQAREAGAATARLHVRAGFAPQLINKVAEEAGAELIVVGANPQPARARSLVGTTGRRVLYLANRPVLVASEARREPFRRVLAAVDLSEVSQAVLRNAWSVARAEGAELRALYVLEPLPMMLARVAGDKEEERRRYGREQLAWVLEAADLVGEEAVGAYIRQGHAGREILEEAQQWNADLIVLGTHGFNFFDRLLLGSTSLYVLRHGQLATLVVPGVQSSERH